MCRDAFIQIIRDAGVKSAVFTLYDINMPCHEKCSSPLFGKASIAAIQYSPSFILSALFYQ